MTATPVRPPRSLAAALAILMSGCSFATVSRVRPPADVDDPRVTDTCTATSQAAVLDTVLGAAGLVAGYGLLLTSIANASCDTTTTGGGTCKPANPGPGLAAIGAGALFAGSAIYGYVSTAQCRRHVEAGGRCANGDLGACQKVKPGWVPPQGWRAGATLEPRPQPAAQPPPAPPAPPAPGAPESPPQPGQPGPAPTSF
jgi:hypothetical protein